MDGEVWNLVWEIFTHTVALFVGVCLTKGYAYLERIYRGISIRWFWNPTDATRISVYCGAFEDALLHLGEEEPVVNLGDALCLGELRLFLERHYKEVVVTTVENAIDWENPVVSLGGPLPNSLTRKIGEQGHLPVWFVELPYSKDSERILESKDGTERFKSKFNGEGLEKDVGFVARVESPKNPREFVYVIAANYGMGNAGVVKFLTSASSLKQLRSGTRSRCFQAVIQSHVAAGKISSTELLYSKPID